MMETGPVGPTTEGKVMADMVKTVAEQARADKAQKTALQLVMEAARKLGDSDLRKLLADLYQERRTRNADEAQHMPKPGTVMRVKKGAYYKSLEEKVVKVAYSLKKRVAVTVGDDIKQHFVPVEDLEEIKS